MRTHNGLPVIDPYAPQAAEENPLADMASWRQLPGSSIGAGLGAGWAGYRAGMGALANALGFDTADYVRKMQEEQQFYQRNAPGATEFFGEKGVAGEGKLSDWLAYNLGQSLPYMGEMLVGGLTGGAALGGRLAATAGVKAIAEQAARSSGKEFATAAAERAALEEAAQQVGRRYAAAGAGGLASYPSAVGDILLNQQEAGGGYDLGMAALGGVPYAALNLMGGEAAALRAATGGLTREVGAEGAKNYLRRTLAGETLPGAVVRGGVKAGVEEGLAETGQEMINQSFGRMAVSPTEQMFSPDAMGRYAESFMAGLGLGGMMGGASQVFSKPTSASPDDIAKRADQLERSMTQIRAGIGTDLAVQEQSAANVEAFRKQREQERKAEVEALKLAREKEISQRDSAARTSEITKDLFDQPNAVTAAVQDLMPPMPPAAAPTTIDDLFTQLSDQADPLAALQRQTLQAAQEFAATRNQLVELANSPDPDLVEMALLRAEDTRLQSVWQGLQAQLHKLYAEQQTAATLQAQLDEGLTYTPRDTGVTLTDLGLPPTVDQRVEVARAAQRGRAVPGPQLQSAMLDQLAEREAQDQAVALFPPSYDLPLFGLDNLRALSQQAAGAADQAAQDARVAKQEAQAGQTAERMKTLETIFDSIEKKDQYAIANMNAALRKAKVPELSREETDLFRRRAAAADTLTKPYPVTQEQETKGRQYGGTELFSLGRQDLLPEADTREADQRQKYRELFGEYVTARGVGDMTTAQKAVDMVASDFTEEERILFKDEMVQEIKDYNEKQPMLDFAEAAQTKARKTRAKTAKAQPATEEKAPEQAPAAAAEPATTTQVKETGDGLQEARQAPAEEVGIAALGRTMRRRKGKPEPVTTPEPETTNVEPTENAAAGENAPRTEDAQDAEGQAAEGENATNAPDAEAAQAEVESEVPARAYGATKVAYDNDVDTDITATARDALKDLDKRIKAYDELIDAIKKCGG